MIRTGRRHPAAALVTVAALGALSFGGAAVAEGASTATTAATATTATTAGTAGTTAVVHRSDKARKRAAHRLHDQMRKLWFQHMEWTYAAVVAFAADSPGLPATLNRLLRNQDQIGNAIKPLYGKAAGAQLTKLLRTHIQEAVPVLTAAKAGDSAALGKAVTAWYANARQIADFLAAANPHWHRAEMRHMMKMHITQTIAYASDQLTGHYAAAIVDYGKAEAHMTEMADMLTDGIIAQFPRKFRR